MGPLERSSSFLPSSRASLECWIRLGGPTGRCILGHCSASFQSKVSRFMRKPERAVLNDTAKIRIPPRWLRFKPRKSRRNFLHCHKMLRKLVPGSDDSRTGLRSRNTREGERFRSDGCATSNKKSAWRNRQPSFSIGHWALDARLKNENRRNSGRDKSGA